MATTQALVRTLPDIFYEDPELVEDHMLQKNRLLRSRSTLPLDCPCLPAIALAANEFRAQWQLARCPCARIYSYITAMPSSRPSVTLRFRIAPSIRPLADCCAAL